MGIESHLLRMLEPAVRPDGINNPSIRPQVPFEARDFDSLLAEASKIAEDATRADEPDAPQRRDLLGALSGVSRIENESLRRLIGRATPEG